MKIIPNEGQVLILKDDVMMSKGGIALPASQKSPLIRGKVLAVGKGAMLHSGQRLENFVKAGDVILFPAEGSIRLPVDEKDVYMCVEAMIVCKLVDEGK